MSLRGSFENVSSSSRVSFRNGLMMESWWRSRLNLEQMIGEGNGRLEVLWWIRFRKPLIYARSIEDEEKKRWSRRGMTGESHTVGPWKRKPLRSRCGLLSNPFYLSSPFQLRWWVSILWFFIEQLHNERGRTIRGGGNNLLLEWLSQMIFFLPHISWCWKQWRRARKSVSDDTITNGFSCARG